MGPDDASLQAASSNRHSDDWAQLSLVPAQHEPARSDNVVLPTGKRWDVVVGGAREEITSFTPKRDEPPDPDIHSRPEVEHPAGELARSGVGLAVDARDALFIVTVPAADDPVG
jgi:hypothetical protein